MPKLLPVTPEREWLSPRDVENIYGFSRFSLRNILREAEAEGTPIEVSVLRFLRTQVSKKHPFIRIRKASLERYLADHYEGSID